MTKPRVLIVGATGRTGGSIITGLLEAGETQVEALVRPASSSNTSILALKNSGVKIHRAEIKDSIELIGILTGVDTVISAIGLTAYLDQIPLADAAKRAGVKRFVPCAFITVCPAGGVMWIRDQKEEIYEHLRNIDLPFTIIDVGNWYQGVFPTLPSGRTDYASHVLPNVTISGDREMKTALIDLRDLGRYVARIVTDDRTLNRYIFCYGQLLSQEEVFGKLEELSGEAIERKYMSPKELLTLRETEKASFTYDLSDIGQALKVVSLDYSYSKFVRGDNSPEASKALGYLDATDLYPDIVPRKFEAFARELVDGKAERIF